MVPKCLLLLLGLRGLVLLLLAGGEDVVSETKLGNPPMDLDLGSVLLFKCPILRLQCVAP